jgi:hypothetical protein
VVEAEIQGLEQEIIAMLKVAVLDLGAGDARSGGLHLWIRMA